MMRSTATRAGTRTASRTAWWNNPQDRLAHGIVSFVFNTSVLALNDGSDRLTWQGRTVNNIALVHCVGSREVPGVHEPQPDGKVNDYCSRVCCMYTIKQAMLLSGSLPLADIYVYYMDIRAFGKGYEQFFQNAMAMGIQFVKGKVATIAAGEDGKVRLRILVDRTTIEVFANDGRIYMPMSVFPPDDKQSLEAFTKGGETRVTTLEVHELRSAWRTR